MKAVLYIRVSTEEQVEGYSIEGQLETTRRYATGKNWHVTEEYVDAGFSARTDGRCYFFHDGFGGCNFLIRRDTEPFDC